LKNQADLFHQCLKGAYRYLGYRPRSEAEMRQWLRRRGFGDETGERVLQELKNQRLVDDEAFARYWKENRQLHRPRSRDMVKLELKQKGIDPETADHVTRDMDDEASGYEAAVKRVRYLASLDYGEFHLRLASYLQRRGFSYGVIISVVKRLWEERRMYLERSR